MSLTQDELATRLGELRALFARALPARRDAFTPP